MGYTRFKCEYTYTYIHAYIHTHIHTHTQHLFAYRYVLLPVCSHLYCNFCCFCHHSCSCTSLMTPLAACTPWVPRSWPWPTASRLGCGNFRTPEARRQEWRWRRCHRPSPAQRRPDSLGLKMGRKSERQRQS